MRTTLILLGVSTVLGLKACVGGEPFVPARPVAMAGVVVPDLESDDREPTFSLAVPFGPKGGHVEYALVARRDQAGELELAMLAGRTVRVAGILVMAGYRPLIVVERVGEPP